MAQAEAAGASVYDLGYRNYTGPRLGRGHAVLALYLYSLRGIFGLGRRTSSKIIPIGLTIVTLLPAVIQVGVVAIATEQIHVFEPDDYYEFIQWPLALFVAAVAPELVGRDQRDGTLSLYFSRALLRMDYVLAKLAAIATALLFLALLPQAVVYVGNIMAGNDHWEFLRENWREIGSIIVTGVLLAVFMGSIALAIGAQTSRWPMASGGIIAYFAISWVVGGILANSFTDGPFRYSLTISGFHVVRGFTLWAFGVTPVMDPGGQSRSMAGDLALAGAPVYAYVLAAAAITGLSLAALYRRYSRLSL